MNVVYWFTFRERVKNKTPPYYYIGSKHNCKIINGVIITSRNKEYWSSCKQSRFLETLEIEKPIVRILSVSEKPLDEEEWYHDFYDVVKSDLFFNKAKARGSFGGAGVNSPRYGMKNTDESRLKQSLKVKGIKKSKEHKENVSKGLNRYFESDDRINNARGKQVLKTWSDSAKRRNSNPLNVHPRGMLGKKMPRVKCTVCGKLVSVNQIKRHTNNCK